MGPKYSSLDHVSVLSVPGVVQSSGFRENHSGKMGRNQTMIRLHSVSERLTRNESTDKRNRSRKRPRATQGKQASSGPDFPLVGQSLQFSVVLMYKLQLERSNDPSLKQRRSQLKEMKRSCHRDDASGLWSSDQNTVTETADYQCNGLQPECWC